jgi:hypothetical protein
MSHIVDNDVVTQPMTSTVYANLAYNHTQYTVPLAFPAGGVGSCE